MLFDQPFVMASESLTHDRDPKLELVHRFFSGTGGSYDSMVNYATFGIDGLWKRRMVNLIPPHSTRILDLACGTGISTRSIATRFPNSHVVGVELRDEYLDIARKKAQALGIRNMEYVLSRAEDYRSGEPFDCVSSSYLAKYAELDVLIPSLKDMLKPDGLLIMHDFTFPPKSLPGVDLSIVFQNPAVGGEPLVSRLAGDLLRPAAPDRADPVGAGVAGRIGETRLQGYTVGISDAVWFGDCDGEEVGGNFAESSLLCLDIDPSAWPQDDNSKASQSLINSTSPFMPLRHEILFGIKPPYIRGEIYLIEPAPEEEARA